jgi:hypothetical protein
MKNCSIVFLAAMTIVVHYVDAFVVPGHCSSSRRELGMVGGRGWDNDDYLNGLSGDDSDRQKVTEDYQDFSRNRQAFLNRQKEALNTPQGRAFLEARGVASRGGIPQPQDMMDLNDLVPNDPAVLDVKPGTGGGSRMARMMAQAEQMKKMGRMNPMMGGFEQKFAVPLDDDETSIDSDN